MPRGKICIHTHLHWQTLGSRYQYQRGSGGGSTAHSTVQDNMHGNSMVSWHSGGSSTSTVETIWMTSILSSDAPMNSGFDGGLQVWKPLLRSDKETLTICQTPHEVRRGGWVGKRTWRGHSMTACGFCNALVSECAGCTRASANVEHTDGMCHCVPFSYLFP